MCGNVGIINREAYKIDSDRLIKYFTQALFTDTLRGRHGTGISAVDQEGNIEVYKKAMSAPDFLDLTHTKNIVENPANIFLCGHNRWATQGSHTDQNTHPFNHDHITMFHNGTLTTVTDLPKGSTFVVDSNAIAHALSIQSVKATLEALDGAFALVWYDAERESINFARNKERPLWFGKLEDTASFVYASEKEMLTWLSSRNSIKLDKMYELPVGKHIEVPLDPEKDVVVESFTPKVASLYSGYGAYAGYSKASTTNTAGTSIVGKTFQCFVTKWESYPSNTEMGSLTASLMNKGSCINCSVSSVTKELGKSLVNTSIDVKITSNTMSNTYGTYIPRLTVVDDIVGQAKKELALMSVPDISYEEDGDLEEPMIRIGPDCNMISEREYDALTKHGCSQCAADLEDDSEVTWDVMNNPYCDACAKTVLYV